ncbi:MAG: peptidoglycan DD-metalloendopeptidase family protein [Negativibacillus sp.]
MILILEERSELLVSNAKKSKKEKTPAATPAESLSSLGHFVYAVCYLVGARIIRFFRRSKRRLKKGALHLKWKLRRLYFDFKDQQVLDNLNKQHHHRQNKDALRQVQQSLQQWKQHREQSSKLLFGEFFCAFRPILPLLAGTVNYLLPVGSMVILISIVLHFSTMTYGLQVQYNGEHIGYILSESAFVEAEAKVRERIVNEAYLPPEDSVPIYSLAIVEDDQISEESVLINNIIRASGNEIEEAAGLYVDGEFIGAVSDGDELLKSLRARKNGTYSPDMPTGEPVEEQPQKETESQEQPQEQTPSNPEPENEQPSTEQLVPERTHTVREGDSLWDIALEYDVTVDQLLQLNPEVSKSMLVGQTLIISQASDSSDSQESSSSPAEDAPAEEAPSEEESPAEEETASAEESSSSRTHTVQDGDSLWDIATQYDVSVEQLQQLNPEVSKSMLVGETLMIPPADSSDAADKQTTSDSVSAEAEKSSETSTASTEQPEQIQTEKAAEEPLSANNEIISFVQSIRVERGLYPVSSVESLQSINVKLDSVVEGEQTYTIQQGDSPSLVADKVGIPTQTLINLNPDVTQSMLVGDVLVISHEQPFLQTKTVKTVTEEKEIAFTTETELDHNKASGYEKVVQEGKNGLEEIVSEVTYIDGYETERTVISKTTLQEPVTAKIVVGSLTSSQYNFSGSGAASTESNVGGYIWPVNGGYISCPIWGYSGHTGTDIAAPAGTTIWASKGGTVAYAGWSNGYGYNVLINHGDGTKTRYAHCSSLAVYTGQQVSQGQVVGYVGQTGWASGNHCHFEIISNGTFLDARNYIGYSR